ncbi:hypothetical protein PCANB_000475 [Pneumocystis canis]|nr:hypothetical protein PCANB_000475 [Pneumocystis canis]
MVLETGVLLHPERSTSSYISPIFNTVNIILDPIVLFLILDYSLRRNHGQDRVIGTLLGIRSEDGSEIEIRNCFVVPHNENQDQVEVDMEYHKTMYELHRKTSPHEVVVGWFATLSQLNTFSALIQNFYSSSPDGTYPFLAVHLTVSFDFKTGLSCKTYISSAVGVTSERMADSCLFLSIPHEIRYYDLEKNGFDSILKAKNEESRQASILTDMDNLEQSIEKILFMLKKVKKYVENVMDGKNQASPVVIRFLMDNMSISPNIDPLDVERMFNNHLQDVLMLVCLVNIIHIQLDVANRLVALMIYCGIKVFGLSFLKWKPVQFGFFPIIRGRNYYKTGYKNIYNDQKLNTKIKNNSIGVVFGIGLSLMTVSILYIYSIDTNPFKYIGLAAIRTFRLISTATLCFNDYRRIINSNYSDEQERLHALSLCHKRCAKRTLSCLENNGGIFIKLGQHLSSMSYLIPYEWTSTMVCLQDKCPSSSMDDIEKMFLEDTGKKLEDFFSFFDEKPVGVASLAQVHRAIIKENGREVAVKIQHPSLKKFTIIDIFLTRQILGSIKRFFPEFTLTWLTEEMEFSLSQELNFKEEEKNAIRIKKYFEKVKKFSVYIPEIIWSEKRILVMEYIKGVRVDDHEYMLANNISRDEVSAELSHIFNEMIFGGDGYLHCDPHCGNLLIRTRPKASQSKYNFEIVLLDHGLYRKIPLDLQRSYAKLWLSIINMNEKDMKQYSYEVAGIGEDKFHLFTSAITGRDFMSLKESMTTKWRENDFNRITVTATRSFVTQLVELLNNVPRIMLLLFKTNDLLRSLDESLKTSYGSRRTYNILRKYCTRVVYKEDLDKLYSRKVSRNYWSPFFFAQYLFCLWRYYSFEVSFYIYEWYLFLSC